MAIILLAACGMNNEIGYKGKLLWKMHGDMQHFIHLTTEKFVLYGRKTYESIGHCLPNRTNIVLSRDKNYHPHSSAFVYYSTSDVLREYKNYAEEKVDLYICGGEEIYEQFLPHADILELTIIDAKFPQADAFFPAFSIDEWKPVSRDYRWADFRNEYGYTYVRYERDIVE